MLQHLFNFILHVQTALAELDITRRK